MAGPTRPRPTSLSHIALGGTGSPVRHRTASSRSVAPPKRRALNTIGVISRNAIFTIGKFTPQMTTRASIANSTLRGFTIPARRTQTAAGSKPSFGACCFLHTAFYFTEFLSSHKIPGHHDGRHHAVGPGDALPGDVERRPVIHRGADERQGQRDAHGAVEIECLRGDVPLVMIQGQHRVVPALQRLGEDRVRGDRTVHLPSLPAGVLHPRRGLLEVLLPSGTTLPGRRVEGRDGNMRPVESQLL